MEKEISELSDDELVIEHSKEGVHIGWTSIEQELMSRLSKENWKRELVAEIEKREKEQPDGFGAEPYELGIIDGLKIALNFNLK